MTNPYVVYYSNQAGSGLQGFTGAKYQHGRGFMGRLFRSTILPALKFLGKRGLKTGADLATDVLAGEDFKVSAKKRLKETGLDVLDAAASSAKKKMTGGRKKRKKAAKKTDSTPKKKKKKAKKGKKTTKKKKKKTESKKEKKTGGKKKKKNKKSSLDIFAM